MKATSGGTSSSSTSESSSPPTITIATASTGDSGPPDVPHTDLTAAAFFDVDNTMMVGASIFHFARGLAARKYFSTRDVARFVWQQAKFRIAGNESADDMHTIRENALGPAHLEEGHAAIGRQLQNVAKPIVAFGAFGEQRLGPAMAELGLDEGQITRLRQAGTI